MQLKGSPMTTTELTEAPVKPRQSLIVRFGERYGVEPQRVMGTLKATAFRSDKPISDEQMVALLIVAEQYHLNPFTREIFAFPDKGGIVPVVSLDGWARIINEHPMMDGCDFHMTDDGSSITCMLYRKDRAHPIAVTEYLIECKRNTPPWNSHPRRMLRHKALIQCARLAFGFAGIYDEDEAARIVHMGSVESEPPSAGAARVRSAIAEGRSNRATTDSVAVDVGTSGPPSSEPSAIIDVDEMPPPRTLASYVHELLDCEEVEQAELVLEEARHELPASQHAELVAAYRGKWQPPE
jgi:phage recombination protein Bet